MRNSDVGRTVLILVNQTRRGVHVCEKERLGDHVNYGCQVDTKCNDITMCRKNNTGVDVMLFRCV